MHKLLAFASRDLAFSFLVALIVPYEVVIFAFACINVKIFCVLGVSVRSLLLHPLCKQSGCGFSLLLLYYWMYSARKHVVCQFDVSLVT